MSELTRKEKVKRLFGDNIKTSYSLAKMEDQEINDLYEEHFKITKEDFKGFEKVWNKFGDVNIVITNKLSQNFINELEKEL